MKTSRNRGFTLLELLIVLVIVGVLTTIVLLATSSARGKGGDAGVKSNLHTVRNQAGLFYANNNTFGPNSWTGSGNGDACPGSLISGTNTLWGDPVIFKAIAKAVLDGGTPSNSSDNWWCYNTPSSWALAISLRSNNLYSWCVDSSGVAKQENFTPEFSFNTTTHLCK